jgi:hypothetical protein
MNNNDNPAVHQAIFLPRKYSRRFIKAKDIHDKDLDGVRKRLSVDEWSITCA